MKQASRATRWVFLSFGMGISSWAPMIPFAKGRLGLNDAQLGLLLQVFGIGAILTMPLSSWLVKRFGSAGVSVASGLFVLLLLPSLTVAPTSLYLGIALFLFGGATSAMNIAINAQAITVESQSEQSLMSGFHCLFSFGGLLGVVLMGILLELKWTLFSCASLVSLCIGLIILLQGKHLLPDKPSVGSSSTSRGVVEYKVFLLGSLCFIAFMAEGSMLEWSAEFLRSSLHYPTSQTGIGYALFSIAMATGRLLGNKIIARLGQQLMFQMSAIVAASGFVILVASLWPYAELLGFVMIGLGASNIVPILFSFSGKFKKTAPHTALAIVTSLGYAGLLMGPPLVGFIANASSLSVALGGIAGLLFLIGFFHSILSVKASDNVVKN
jgi:predicted MFS family arabinose efflux permease